MTVRTRLAAVVATGLLVSIPGLLITQEAANAVSVTSPSSGEIRLDLNANETAAVAASLDSSASYCSQAINQATSSGIYFSDSARQVCQHTVWTCADKARNAQRTQSGVLFARFSDGSQAAYCL